MSCRQAGPAPCRSSTLCHISGLTTQSQRGLFIGWSGTVRCNFIGDFSRLARHLAADCYSVSWFGTLPQHLTAYGRNRRLWYPGCNAALGDSGRLVRHLAAAYPCDDGINYRVAWLARHLAAAWSRPLHKLFNQVRALCIKFDARNNHSCRAMDSSASVKVCRANRKCAPPASEQPSVIVVLFLFYSIGTRTPPGLNRGSVCTAACFRHVEASNTLEARGPAN